jgi:hypothetical protein
MLGLPASSRYHYADLRGFAHIAGDDAWHSGGQLLQLSS